MNVEIRCRTNIDCWKKLEWPRVLPARPMVGDSIYSISNFLHRQMRNEYVNIEARVGSVSFVPKMERNSFNNMIFTGTTIIEVWLSLPSPWAEQGLATYWEKYWTPVTGLSRG